VPPPYAAPFTAGGHAVNDIYQSAKKLLVGFSLDGVEHDIDKGTRFDIVDRANGAAGDCLRFSARDAL